MTEKFKNELDKEFFQKYSVTGPRYTSYPTAPHFKNAMDVQTIKGALIRSKNSLKDLSLYFHLPYCDTLCYFCACNMIRSNNRDRISKYLSYLVKEMKMYAALTENRPVVQMHWGGGTPSHLNPDEILEIGEHINNHFNIVSNAELSVEVDPRGLSDDHLDAFREIGINRISIGVQDFNERVQKAVNRIHSFDLIEELFEKIRMRGFHGINLDLMYGLPFQNQRSFEKTIKLAIDLKPERMALFHFAYLPEMKKHQRIIKKEDLPSAEEKLNIFMNAHNALTENGYSYIGMDHFALESDELAIAAKNKTMTRNFQGYSTKKNTDIIAMGVTGISQIENVYSQNMKSEKEYFDLIDKNMLPLYRGYKLDQSDEMIREIIMTLMCDLRLDIQTIEQKYAVDFNNEFKVELDRLHPLQEDGLILLRPDVLIVTEKGRYAIRNIVMVFDRYLKKGSKIFYSRTI